MADITLTTQQQELLNQINQNTTITKEWIPRKPSVFKIEKFENDIVDFLTDSYAPVYKVYKSDSKESESQHTFTAPKGGCVAFVLVQGGSGGGSTNRGYWTTQYNVGFSGPICGNWDVDSQVSHKTQYSHKVQKERLWVINGNSNNNGGVTTFGKYLSANGGLGVESSNVTHKEVLKNWHLKGWASVWDWGAGQTRDRYELNLYKYEYGKEILLVHTHNPHATKDYYGNLVGQNGEVKFGIFVLGSNEVVPITIGRSFHSEAHVDVVYFELQNEAGQSIEKPSEPNNVLQGVILPAQLELKITPENIELTPNSTITLEIITNAISLSCDILDVNIASFNLATRSITAISVGDTTLRVTAEGENKRKIIKDLPIKVVAATLVVPTPTLLVQPQELVLEKDSISAPLQITTKDTQTLESSILDSNIASFNETTKEVTAINVGQTMLKFIAKNEDKETSQGVRIEVIAKQVVINPNNLNVDNIDFGEFESKIQDYVNNSFNNLGRKDISAFIPNISQDIKDLTGNDLTQNNARYEQIHGSDTNSKALSSTIKQDYIDAEKDKINELIQNGTIVTQDDLDKYIKQRLDLIPSVDLNVKIYYKAFKKTSATAEQAAYSYALMQSYGEVFKPIQNDNKGAIAIKTLTQSQKDFIQKYNYKTYIDMFKKANNVLSNAAVLEASIEILAKYIESYTKIQGWSQTHLELLNTLIEPKVQEIDGVTYTHAFKDFVVNMDNETYLQNLTKWIPELDSIITRDLNVGNGGNNGNNGNNGNTTTPTAPETKPTTLYDANKVHNRISTAIKSKLIKFRDNNNLNGVSATHFMGVYQAQFGLPVKAMQVYNTNDDLDTFIETYSLGKADEGIKYIESNVAANYIKTNSQLEKAIQDHIYYNTFQ